MLLGIRAWLPAQLIQYILFSIPMGVSLTAKSTIRPKLENTLRARVWRGTAPLLYDQIGGTERKLWLALFA